jgi:hypothetical protein
MDKALKKEFSLRDRKKLLFPLFESAAGNYYNPISRMVACLSRCIY